MKCPTKAAHGSTCTRAKKHSQCCPDQCSKMFADPTQAINSQFAEVVLLVFASSAHHVAEPLNQKVSLFHLQFLSFCFLLCYGPGLRTRKVGNSDSIGRKRTRSTCRGHPTRVVQGFVLALALALSLSLSRSRSLALALSLSLSRSRSLALALSLCSLSLSLSLPLSLSLFFSHSLALSHPKPEPRTPALSALEELAGLASPNGESRKSSYSRRALHLQHATLKVWKHGNHDCHASTPQG